MYLFLVRYFLRPQRRLVSQQFPCCSGASSCTDCASQRRANKEKTKSSQSGHGDVERFTIKSMRSSYHGDERFRSCAAAGRTAILLDVGGTAPCNDVGCHGYMIAVLAVICFILHRPCQFLLHFYYIPFATALDGGGNFILLIFVSSPKPVTIVATKYCRRVYG